MSYWNDFKAVSSWTTNPPNDNYVLSPGGEWYFHSDLGPLAGWGFVSPYAMQNPTEDWAETFAYYFTVGTSSANYFIDEKLDAIALFLISLWD